MPDHPTHIFVLVEDKEQQNLIRRFLDHCGIRSPRFEPLPHGHGSGEQYVRQQFPLVLKKLRSSLGRRVSAMLIVMIDADRGEVQTRHAQLTGANADEPVVILIPRRNVETCVAALNGELVNEHDDYKAGFGDPVHIRVAAENLYACTRPNAQIPQNFPPSLKAALPDWNRIGESAR